ncbi:MAG: hypothetical protein LBR37_03820 [Erysipelotrichaceae bacterium]|jgi:hypothetical protein|nr:hypothetical protein [Erysipelotrichaceae bacterium]
MKRILVLLLSLLILIPLHTNISLSVQASDSTDFVWQEVDAALAPQLPLPVLMSQDDLSYEGFNRSGNYVTLYTGRTDLLSEVFPVSVLPGDLDPDYYTYQNGNANLYLRESASTWNFIFQVETSPAYESPWYPVNPFTYLQSLLIDKELVLPYLFVNEVPLVYVKVGPDSLAFTSSKGVILRPYYAAINYSMPMPGVRYELRLGVTFYPTVLSDVSGRNIRSITQLTNNFAVSFNMPLSMSGKYAALPWDITSANVVDGDFVVSNSITGNLSDLAPFWPIGFKGYYIELGAVTPFIFTKDDLDVGQFPLDGGGFEYHIYIKDYAPIINNSLRIVLTEVTIGRGDSWPNAVIDGSISLNNLSTNTFVPFEFVYWFDMAEGIFYHESFGFNDVETAVADADIAWYWVLLTVGLITVQEYFAEQEVNTRFYLQRFGFDFYFDREKQKPIENVTRLVAYYQEGQSVLRNSSGQSIPYPSIDKQKLDVSITEFIDTVEPIFGVDISGQTDGFKEGPVKASDGNSYDYCYQNVTEYVDGYVNDNLAKPHKSFINWFSAYEIRYETVAGETIRLTGNPNGYHVVNNEYGFPVVIDLDGNIHPDLDPDDTIVIEGTPQEDPADPIDDPDRPWWDKLLDLWNDNKDSFLTIIYIIGGVILLIILISIISRISRFLSHQKLKKDVKRLNKASKPKRRY